MIEIKSIHKDSHSGQDDFALVAEVDGDFAGKLDYSMYRARVAVQGINVLQSKRRQGVGTALLVALQEAYPDHAILFGMTTSDGNALLGSLEWRVEVNQVVADAVEEIAILEQRLMEYQSRAEEILKLPQDDRAPALETLADWDEITDRVDELGHIVNTQPAQFRYIVSPSVAPAPGI